MASISSLGIGSGLDLNSLLANIQNAESANLSAIQSQQQSYNSKLSAYGQIKSTLTAFQSAAAALGAKSLFGSATTTASNTATLTSSADSTAVSGNYTITVNKLASAQSLVAAGTAAANTAIGNGTIKIELGTTSGTSFTPGSGTPASITIGNGNNTLAGIRDAINQANAGVTASIVNDGSGTPYRLALTSTTGGAAATMRISVTGNGTDDPAALDNLVAYDPAGTKSMTESVPGADASLSVNGIPVSSATNTVTGAAQGLTLNLQALGTSTVTVKSDTATITTAVKAFVDAFNKLQSTAKTLTSFNPDTKAASTLTGDGTLRNIQTQLRSALNTAQPGGANGINVLTQAGLSFTTDGTLSLDTDKLGKALANNLNGVTQFFSGVDGKSGLANQMSDLVGKITGSKGSLTNATDGINKTLRTLSDRLDSESTRISTMMDTYRQQFSQLDLLVNKMNSTSSYLTQQFGAMNNVSTK
ncbi:flagellar filament capping protein FliD [Cupriavidus numazuensis]|uniref:Flagellar hook-associated protein 2 n=1 Tax=Cupriavidus numazuensis TaxID=221992 RepID=A0ABN7PTQ4_9BURK|nr:flagellar filament capping protein FliD [Cupriavidus numazuensis]CAG2135041.1 Flagellar hook-associated protein 2 [Cupriavidus numazuensis]